MQFPLGMRFLEAIISSMRHKTVALDDSFCFKFTPHCGLQFRDALQRHLLPLSNKALNPPILLTSSKIDALWFDRTQNIMGNDFFCVWGCVDLNFFATFLSTKWLFFKG